MTYELNVRAMLFVFTNGTGGCGVICSFVIMGLGGKSFERTIHRNSGYIHKTIMRVTKRFVHTALLDEICASIEAMINNGGKDALEWCVILEKIKINQLNELKTHNVPLPISVSYAMGW